MGQIYTIFIEILQVKEVYCDSIWKW